MKAQEFLKLTEPWKYDFKFLHFKEPDSIERYVAYRTAYRNGSGFDCDCDPLTMELQCLLYGASNFKKRYISFLGEEVETDTINSFWTRYKRAENKDAPELRKFAIFTHTIGNFNVGPKSFNVAKGRSFNWRSVKFDRFDSFCEKNLVMKKWFFERKSETFMDMYFKKDGSLVPLDDIAVVNDLIIQRGKQIVEMLKSKSYGK